MSNEATLIFPHQLFKNHPAVKKNRMIFLIEDPYFFTRFAFHKQKLMLHRASMKTYFDQLKKKHKKIHYVTFKNAKKIQSLLRKHKVSHLHVVDVIEKELERSIDKLSKNLKVDLTIYDSPMFICTPDYIHEALGTKKTFFLYPFYVQQRKRLDILLTKNEKPIGNSWTFDTKNREKIPPQIAIPEIYIPKENKYIIEARRYVAKHFPKNPGSTQTFVYPINAQSAQRALSNFLKKRFKLFGPYQDAIEQDEPFLFHSVLSSSLNIGLLTPEHVVDASLAYAKKHKIPINSVEGFIRQIIGWREFVYGVYLLKGNKQQRGNFFKFRKKISKHFYDGTTGIEPVDNAIKRIGEYAYAHHIERLMVLGNIMLLSEIKPDEVYTWFMELFIDAYDWVMIPNVYGMSQYADGGLMVTKPYFSGSAYILRMSNYKKDAWCSTWNALYWHFVHKHKKVLQKIPRTGIMINMLKKKNKTELKEQVTLAQKFIKKQTIL